MRVVRLALTNCRRRGKSRSRKAAIDWGRCRCALMFSLAIIPTYHDLKTPLQPAQTTRRTKPDRPRRRVEPPPST